MRWPVSVCIALFCFLPLSWDGAGTSYGSDSMGCSRLLIQVGGDEEVALLKGIVANPGDDAPRLVYADWLDEHDHSARAEFIRTQVSIAQLEKLWTAFESLELMQLYHYQHAFYMNFGEAWMSQLPALPRGNANWYKKSGGKDGFPFYRGFPHGLIVWVGRQAPELLLEHPFVTFLWLEGVMNQAVINRWVADPLFLQIRHVRFNQVEQEWLSQMFSIFRNSPYSKNVEHFTLYPSGLPTYAEEEQFYYPLTRTQFVITVNESLVQMAQSSSMTHLRVLEVFSLELSDATARAMMRSQNFLKLEKVPFGMETLSAPVRNAFEDFLKNNAIRNRQY